MPDPQKTLPLSKEEKQKLDSEREKWDRWLKAPPKTVMDTWREKQPQKMLPAEHGEFPMLLDIKTGRLVETGNYGWKALFRDKDNPDIIKAIAINRGGHLEIAFNEVDGKLHFTNDGVRIDNTTVSFPELPFDCAAQKDLCERFTDKKRPGLLRHPLIPPTLTESEVSAQIWNWPAQQDPARLNDTYLWLPQGGSTVDLSELTDPTLARRIVIEDGSHTRTVIGEKTRGVVIINMAPEDYQRPHGLVIPQDRADCFDVHTSAKKNPYLYLKQPGSAMYGAVYLIGHDKFDKGGLSPYHVDVVRPTDDGKGFNGLIRVEVNKHAPPDQESGTPLLSLRPEYDIKKDVQDAATALKFRAAPVLPPKPAVEGKGR